MSGQKRSEWPVPPIGYGTRTSMARADRPSAKYEITAPRDLWARIDEAAASQGVSRAAWMRGAAEEKLARGLRTDKPDSEARDEFRDPL